MNPLPVLEKGRFIEQLPSRKIGKNWITFVIVECGWCSRHYEARKGNITTRGRAVCIDCVAKERNGDKHGISNHPLYTTWMLIKRRVCNTVNNRPVKEALYYKDIELCEDWMTFIPFKEWAETHGYKKGLTIDRIDGAGHYEPNNCRWVDQSVQNANKSLIAKGTKTGYVGIGMSGRPNYPYSARVMWKGKSLLQKRFKTLAEALAARNKVIVDNDLPHPIQEIENDINKT